jgi:hypothetical protein
MDHHAIGLRRKIVTKPEIVPESCLSYDIEPWFQHDPCKMTKDGDRSLLDCERDDDIISAEVHRAKLLA